MISFLRLGGTLSRIAGARFDGKARGVRGARVLRLDLTTVRGAADGTDHGAAAIPKHLNVIRGKSFEAINFNGQGCWPLTPLRSTSNQ